MEPIRIAQDLEENFPDSILDIVEHRGQISVIVHPESIVLLCMFLKGKHKMNHLNCLCGVDNLTRTGKHYERFEVIYQFYSIQNRTTLRLKAQIQDSEGPVIDSITSLWTGADWLERETYDLVGITFSNHPNLKRVLNPDGFEGHPLQKKYKLRGDTEWSGFTELKKKAIELQEFDFNPPRVTKGGDLYD